MFLSEIITQSYLLCFDGTLLVGSSTDVIPPLCRLMFLTDTPICVPSQASSLGVYLHHGSTSFWKSIWKPLSHPKHQLINVFGLMNFELWMLFVMYHLVISLQKLVKDILLFFTSAMKSCPISSPAAVSIV